MTGMWNASRTWHTRSSERSKSCCSSSPSFSRVALYSGYCSWRNETPRSWTQPTYSEWSGEGRALDAHDVRGVEPFVPLLHFELHHLTLGERLEAVHLNRREVHEHVFAAFLLNEAVPLGVIEPLHLALDHDPPPAESVTGPPRPSVGCLPGRGVGRRRNDPRSGRLSSGISTVHTAPGTTRDCATGCAHNPGSPDT